MKVLGGMLAGGAVAAPYVTAGQAQAEVDPAAPVLEALLTSCGCMWLDRVELGSVGTAVGHKLLGVTFELHNFYKLLEEARSLVL
jgi:hypothetical protein